MAFLRGRVWDTNPASQSWILGPREPFVAPAPAREQSLSRDTPEPRLRTCPTWAAAPPSPGAGAGAIPSLAGQSMAQLLKTRRLQGGKGKREDPPTPSCPGGQEALSPLLPSRHSPGEFTEPRRGSQCGMGAAGLLLVHNTQLDNVISINDSLGHPRPWG